MEQLTISNLLDSPQWPAIYRQQAARGVVREIRNLPYPTIGLEIGVNLGLNSFFMLNECPNIAKLIGVDHYQPYVDWDRPITISEQVKNFGIMQQNLPLLGDRFDFMRMDSQDAAEILEDDSYDFVFIDGGHSMKQVLMDLDSYWPKIRSGGIIAGHDSNLFSVNFAVTSWTKRMGVRQSGVRMVENDAWYFIKP